MTLTAEQRRALAHGKAVPVTVDGNECVLLRAEVYRRAERILKDSDPAGSYPAVLRAWDTEGDPRDAEAYADLGRRP